MNIYKIKHIGFLPTDLPSNKNVVSLPGTKIGVVLFFDFFEHHIIFEKIPLPIVSFQNARFGRDYQLLEKLIKRVNRICRHRFLL